jgi:hypothetical protein
VTICHQLPAFSAQTLFELVPVLARGLEIRIIAGGFVASGAGDGY